MKIVTVIGARPQIIKSAAISRAISTHFSDQIQELTVHTGQHYDDSMSEVFFRQMSIPKPAYNLGIGSGSHGAQTAAMMKGIEDILLKEKPEAVIVYGDTNSTLAAAVASVKLHIPVVHIEAGLRSFNKSMPEEINRIVCDHCSSLLFTPTKAGIVNLIKEGFCEDNKGPYSPDNPGIFLSGDVMYDNSIYFSAIAAQHSAILKENGLVPEGFALVTIHRDFNTDNPQNLTNIFTALQEVTEKYPFELFVPLHPRTAKILGTVLPESLYSKIISNTKIKLAGPVSFFDMIELEKNCAIVITDSGGVQKEAYFFKKPCVILRPETEWIELVENGNAILAGSDPEKIAEGLRLLYGNTGLTYPELYGDGRTSEKICDVVLKGIKK